VLSVKGDRRLAASVLAFKVADRRTRSLVRDETAAAFRPEWVDGVRTLAAASARFGPYPDLLATGVTFQAGNPPTARAYQRTRPLSGGANPGEIGRQYERGGVKGKRGSRVDQITRTYTSTSPKGRRFTITDRHTARQMAPRRDRGYAVWPVVADIAPAVVAFWTASIVRAYRRAADGIS